MIQTEELANEVSYLCSILNGRFRIICNVRQMIWVCVSFSRTFFRIFTLAKSPTLKLIKAIQGHPEPQEFAWTLANEV